MERNSSCDPHYSAYLLKLARLGRVESQSGIAELVDALRLGLVEDLLGVVVVGVRAHSGLESVSVARLVVGIVQRNERLVYLAFRGPVSGRRVSVQVSCHVRTRREPFVALEAIAEVAALAVTLVGSVGVDALRLRVTPIQLPIGALVDVLALLLGLRSGHLRGGRGVAGQNDLVLLGGESRV